MKDISFFLLTLYNVYQSNLMIRMQKKALYTWELYAVIINFQCVQDFVFADY